MISVLAQFFLALILSILSGLTIVAGGLIFSARNQWKRDTIDLFIAVGAGYILSVSLLDMIPQSLEGGADNLIWVLLGYLVVHLFQHVLPLHFHFGEEIHPEHLLQKSVGFSALVGLMVHNFFSGIAIGAGVLNGTGLGLLVFIGVVLHKLPEGFTISSILFATRNDTRYSLPATGSLALASLAGTLLVFISGLSSARLLNIILALAAGTFIHVATTDLVPEINLSEKRFHALMIFGGVLLYYLTGFFFHWSGLR